MFSPNLPVRRNLHQQMVEALAEQIVSGQVAEGKTLPNEETMGKSYNVSRTVVREAVKVLTSKGLLEVRTKIGARVRPQTDWALSDPDLIGWKLNAGGDSAFVSEVLETRRLLDPAAAAAAAKSATADNKSLMKEAFERMESATGDAERFALEESRFFDAIRDAAGNRILRSMSRLIGSVLPAPGTKSSVATHRRILEAIIGGKADEARKAMERLVASSAEDVSKAILKAQRARKKG